MVIKFSGMMTNSRVKNTLTDFRLKCFKIMASKSDNAKFYASKIIKVTSGFDFKKTIFSARWRHHPKNS